MPRKITRARAKERGLSFFFTGVMCGHRHISERYVVSGACVRCARGRALQWAKNNPEKHNAHSAKWQREHPEKHRAKGRRWRQNNPEKHRAHQKAWKEANPDKVRAGNQRQYYKDVEKSRKRCRVGGAAARRSDPEKFKERDRKWRRSNPDKIAVRKEEVKKARQVFDTLVSQEPSLRATLAVPYRRRGEVMLKAFRKLNLE